MRCIVSDFSLSRCLCEWSMWFDTSSHVVSLETKKLNPESADFHNRLWNSQTIKTVGNRQRVLFKCVVFRAPVVFRHWFLVCLRPTVFQRTSDNFKSCANRQLQQSIERSGYFTKGFFTCRSVRALAQNTFAFASNNTKCKPCPVTAQQRRCRQQTGSHPQDLTSS